MSDEIPQTEPQGEQHAEQHAEQSNDAPVASTPVAPVVSIIPEGHVHVDVPEHIQAQLPPGSQVSMSPRTELVASIPAATGTKHVAAEVGEIMLDALVIAVRAYLSRGA